jgi:hypothetical protein
MLKFLALLIGVANAQAVGTPSYLIFPSQVQCMQRSQAQCQALGCDGVNTIFWWDCTTGPLSSGLVGARAVTAGSYAMRIESTGPFSAIHPSKGVGLTALEQTSLASPTAIAPVLPPAPTPLPANTVVGP